MIMNTLCKREKELKSWLERGSNNWHESYFEYAGRRQNIVRPIRTIKSWFNRTLKSLKGKGYFPSVGFVFESDIELGLRWVNPLVQGQGTDAIVGEESTIHLLDHKPVL